MKDCSEEDNKEKSSYKYPYKYFQIGLKGKKNISVIIKNYGI